MTLNLVRRSVKGAPLDAADHDGNLDKLEGAIEDHESAVDPHPQYQTEAEADARYATAAQGTDAREWTADTIGQAEAEAGTATTRRAFTAQRVFQAVAAWWAASSAASKLAGIEDGAEVNVNADWNATSGDAQILNKPAIPALSDATPQAPGTAAAGTSSTASRSDHRHDLPPVVSTSTAGLRPALGFDTITYDATVALDLATLNGAYKTISLTGNIEFTTSNLANGRTVVLRLVADGTQRTLTFPTDWKFLGTKPATIAASKVGVLSLTAFGTTNADVIAAWGVQS